MRVRPIALATLCAAVLFSAVSGCLGGAESIDGPCQAGEPPLLLVSAGVNTAEPPPAALAFIHPDGEVWDVTLESRTVQGAWNASTMRTEDALPVALRDLCSALSAAGRYPAAATDRGPVVANMTWRTDIEIHEVQVEQASPDAMAQLKQALRERFFDLPADASIEGCEDGSWISYQAALGTRTHASRGNCQWTAEFEAFRVEASAFFAALDA